MLDDDNLASFEDHRGGLGVTTLGMNVSSFMAATGVSWHYKFDISSMAMKSMFDMKCRARKSILNFMPLAKIHESSIVMFGVLQCTGFWLNNFECSWTLQNSWEWTCVPKHLSGEDYMVGLSMCPDVRMSWQPHVLEARDGSSLTKVFMQVWLVCYTFTVATKWIEDVSLV